MSIDKLAPFRTAKGLSRRIEGSIMRFLSEDTTVLAGYGFDGKGPYLLINDVEKAAQYRFSVRNKTFTMKRLPDRYCVGRFDLLTHQKSVCPLRVELLPSEKDGMCPACKEATGFNPSFYYAEAVSPQQRVYNETPPLRISCIFL